MSGGFLAVTELPLSGRLRIIYHLQLHDPDVPDPLRLIVLDAPCSQGKGFEGRKPKYMRTGGKSRKRKAERQFPNE